MFKMVVLFVLFCTLFLGKSNLNGTADMQIEKALIHDRLRNSKVS